MKHNTIETAPFVYRYFLVNRFTKAEFGPFDSILEAKQARFKEYHYAYINREMYGDSLSLSHREAQYFFYYNENLLSFEKPFCIRDQFGNVIPPSVIKAAGNEYNYKSYSYYTPCWMKRQRIEANLVKKKGDGNKIKSDWGFIEDYNHHNEVRYCNRVRKRPHTQSERRANAGCVKEHGEGMVRGKRRYMNIPNSWDFYDGGFYDTMPSWKHNSRRRKQWKPKEEM